MVVWLIKYMLWSHREKLHEGRSFLIAKANLGRIPCRVHWVTSMEANHLLVGGIVCSCICFHCRHTHPTLRWLKLEIVYLRVFVCFIVQADL